MARISSTVFCPYIHFSYEVEQSINFQLSCVPQVLVMQPLLFLDISAARKASMLALPPHSGKENEASLFDVISKEI